MATACLTATVVQGLAWQRHHTYESNGPDPQVEEASSCQLSTNTIRYISSSTPDSAGIGIPVPDCACAAAQACTGNTWQV